MTPLARKRHTHIFRKPVSTNCNITVQENSPIHWNHRIHPAKRHQPGDNAWQLCRHIFAPLQSPRGRKTLIIKTPGNPRRWSSSRCLSHQHPTRTSSDEDAQCCEQAHVVEAERYLLHPLHPSYLRDSLMTARRYGIRVTSAAEGILSSAITELNSLYSLSWHSGFLASRCRVHVRVLEVFEKNRAVEVVQYRAHFIPVHSHVVFDKHFIQCCQSKLAD